MAGYGVARIRTGRESQTGRRVLQTTQTLFNYDALLTPVELILRRLQDFVGTERFTAAMSIIKKALKLPDDTDISLPPGGGVEIRSGPAKTPILLESWADGYRLNFSWIVDFFGVAMGAGAISDQGSVHGILLLDEIEQHTHPSIQEGLVSELKNLWPDLQIITTTHSPLIVLGTQAKELVVMKRDYTGQVTSASPPSSYIGYTAEDILSDRQIFNTSIISAEQRQLTERYQELVAEESRSEADERELRAIIKDLRPAEKMATQGEVQRDMAISNNGDGERLIDELKSLRQKYGL